VVAIRKEFAAYHDTGNWALTSVISIPAGTHEIAVNMESSGLYFCTPSCKVTAVIINQ